MNEILSIHDLSVNYGGIEAVKGISFDVHEGEIVTLIGANGAGKSSTLRTIAGLVKPSGGTINFRGDNITGRDATTIVKKGITLVPEGRHIFPDLTVLGKSQGRRVSPQRRHLRRYPVGIRPFPAPARALVAGGRHAFRRRAADAGCGPRTHGTPEAHYDGRAVARPCAARCARYL